MDNSTIRRSILEILFKRFKENPNLFVSREELLKVIYWPLDLDSNIIYLEEKGYVELQKAFGTPFIGARIKAKGIDLLENGSEFNIKFPIRQNITHIEGNMVGVVSQGDNAQIVSQVQIGESFSNILKEIESSRDFDVETKRVVKSRVQEIYTEIQKSGPNASKVKLALNFLEEKAKWVYDKIVTDPLFTSILVEVAKKSFLGS